MRIFITGVTGFLGSALAEHFRMHGHNVRGSSHDEANLVGLGDVLEYGVRIGFGGQVPLSVFESCDAVLHCAYDPSVGAMERNYEGTKAILESAARAGVPHQVFISSHSARSDAASSYGKLKYRLEILFLDRNQTVVRPGLIVGPGGLYAQNHGSLMRFPLIILPVADMSPVFFISLSNLLTAMTIIVDRKLTGAFNLFHDPPATLRGFVSAVSTLSGRRVFVLSIPAKPLFMAMGLVQQLIDPMPPGLARIETLRKNLYCPVHRSNLKQFVSEPMGLDASIIALQELTDNLSHAERGCFCRRRGARFCWQCR